MKEKEKLLRIRPFNMANFSSGAGFLAFNALLGSIFVIPLTFFIWCGVASSIEKIDGKLDYTIFKRRANRVFLPIMILLFVIGLGMVNPETSLYFSRSQFNHWVAAIWMAAYPTLGMYCVVRTVAAMLNSSQGLTKMGLLVGTFIAGAFLAIIGFIVSAAIAENVGVSFVIIIPAVIAIIVLIAKKLFKG